eukprot:scaffold3526_cov77-Phaeocystis_antarctica.AAC.3
MYVMIYSARYPAGCPPGNPNPNPKPNQLLADTSDCEITSQIKSGSSSASAVAVLPFKRRSPAAPPLPRLLWAVSSRSSVHIC